MRGEFRIRELHRQNRGQAFSRIISRGRDFFLLRGEFLFDVVVQGARQGSAVAREVRTAVLLRNPAVFLRNIVRIAIHAFLIRVVPLHRHFDLRVAVAGLEPQHGGMYRGPASIEMSDESFQSTFVLKDFRLLVALVHQFDADTGIQKRQFAQPFRQRVVVERNVREDLRAGLEAQCGAAFGRLAHRDQRRLRLAEAILLAMEFAVAPDIEFEEIGKRVDDGNSDTVQTAGDLVRRVVELSAGVQHRHDDFRCGDPLLAVDVDGNAAAVVGHGYRFIRVDGYDDAVAIPSERLVDGIVHDLEDHVVQSAAVVGVADVHSGPFSNGVEAPKYFDFAGIVNIVLSHSESSRLRPGILAVFHLENEMNGG